MTTPGTILLVEDNEDDVFLMRRALKAARITNPLAIAEDGQKAVDYFSSCPAPILTFLDLMLPLKSGFAVLAWLRAQPGFTRAPVVVLTSSNQPSDSQQAYDLGANAYMVKPPTPAAVLKTIRLIGCEGLEFRAPAPPDR